MAKPQRSKSAQGKKRAFLAAFAACGNILAACKAANVGRTSHYRWLAEDPEYPAEFAQAQEDAADALEREAWRRAVEGVEKPTGWFKGAPGGVVREYSDTLLIFLLKGARPDKYRERTESQVKVEDATAKVATDEDWYGNAHRLAAASNGASNGSAAKSGSAQGGSVRASVGKNGHGTNGNSKGTRTT